MWKVLICLCCSVTAQLVAGGPLPPDDASSGSPVEPLIKPVPAIAPTQADTGGQVDWTTLYKQSGRLLAVMHVFRLATEPGTREAGSGLGRGYLRSVRNLHGWSDGDPMYVNYVGHPMQGSVVGHAWMQNDRRYRTAEFGRNPDYWKGKLRATVFAWAFSEQFEIGPLSEASIGHIQSVYPQQGFVDHVITPALGLAWMLAEDSIDKYLIKTLEERTNRVWLRLLMRTGLNPSRSFANVMGGRAPWRRDTREGARSYRAGTGGPMTAKSTRAPGAVPRRLAPFEFTATPTFRRFGGAGACAGGAAAGAFRLSPDWLVAVEIGGCKLIGLDANLSGDQLTYVVGPRWAPASGGRWSPYAQVLLGGTKITREQVFPEKKSALALLTPKTGLLPSAYEEYARREDTSGFALAAGTGVDLKLNPALALRLASIEYSHAYVNRLSAMNYSSALQVAVGMVLRVGTW